MAMLYEFELVEVSSYILVPYTHKTRAPQDPNSQPHVYVSQSVPSSTLCVCV
jgi:hypothetical protein